MIRDTMRPVADLESEEARRFVSVAAEYCALIEKAEHLTRAVLLRQLDRLLPRVYHAGCTLADVEPDSSEIASRDLPSEEARRLVHVLSDKLGPYDPYSEMFNPVDREDHAPVGGMLSGDLAETYEDLWNALAVARGGTASAADVLWEWRFGFVSHWGRHVASALRVVNALLHTEYVDVLEESPHDA